MDTDEDKVEGMFVSAEDSVEIWGYIAHDIEFSINGKNSSEVIREFEKLEAKFGWKKHDDN